jgi:hypothetical protein
MAFHYRIGAAILIALSVYGGSGVAGPRWTPIGGSDLAQMGVVFGVAFIVGEITEILVDAWRSGRRSRQVRRRGNPKPKRSKVPERLIEPYADSNED